MRGGGSGIALLAFAPVLISEHFPSAILLRLGAGILILISQRNIKSLV